MPAADCTPAHLDLPGLSVTLVLLIIAAGAASLALLVRRKSGHRQQAMRQVLDAADALEARLRAARAEIEAITGDQDDPVRAAMQEMLRQRLWLQQYGDAASLQELGLVRDSIDDARRRIDQQLVQIERARAPLH